MTLAARLVHFLPRRPVAAAARAVYPRFEPELARLDEMCPPHCVTAVDVGGWYGPWSRQLARRARHVHTVEPVPHLAQLLRGWAPENVTVHQAAAGDSAGTAQLWLPDGDRGDRGVSSLVRREIHGRHLDVDTLALDELGLTDVGFVKIDVDGSELSALHGAGKLLDRDQPALFVELEHRIGPVAPVVDFLAELGYEGWVLPGRNWLPLEEFDLRAHQERTAHVVASGLLRRVMPLGRGPRYVNSVLFLPQGVRPGEPATWRTKGNARR